MSSILKLFADDAASLGIGGGSAARSYAASATGEQDQALLCHAEMIAAAGLYDFEKPRDPSCRDKAFSGRRGWRVQESGCGPFLAADRRAETGPRTRPRFSPPRRARPA